MFAMFTAFVRHSVKWVQCQRRMAPSLVLKDWTGKTFHFDCTCWSIKFLRSNDMSASEDREWSKTRTIHLTASRIYKKHEVSAVKKKGHSEVIKTDALGILIIHRLFFLDQSGGLTEKTCFPEAVLLANNTSDIFLFFPALAEFITAG